MCIVAPCAALENHSVREYFPSVTNTHDDMNIKSFFRTRTTPLPTRERQEERHSLRIDGIGQAPITPEPDDVELAAQALLEILTQKSQETQKGLQSGKERIANTDTQADENLALASEQIRVANPVEQAEQSPRDAKYYHHLAERICQTRECQRLRVTRFLAFVEQELRKPHLPSYGPGSLGLLEAELFKRMDIVDREQGPLKRRWQHALAEVTVRLMKATRTELTESTAPDNPDTPPDGNEGD